MMDKEAVGMLRQSVLPVLLGDRRSAALFAWRIALRCGVESYVCDTSTSFLCSINPYAKNYLLFSESEHELILESLSYIADTPDYLPVLIVCGDKYRSFVEEKREELEARFIITDRKNAFSRMPMSVL